MKRLDKNAAIKAPPVKIATTILAALGDASESQEAEITITLMKDLEGTGMERGGAGVRIQYGSSNTFVEHLDRAYPEDLWCLENVFRFLSTALAQRDKEGKDEIWAAEQASSIEAATRAGASYERAIARDAEFLAKKGVKDPVDAE
jgi:hypothetical protein